jgi:hypothetical protein
VIPPLEAEPAVQPPGRWRQVLARGRALPRGLIATWKTPLGKLLGVALVLRLIGLGWGLPASDGWDDDGVAPRDFLVGVVETYWPGHHYIYPPLHVLLLAIVEAPVWVLTLLGAPSLSRDAVLQTFLAVTPMTAMAVVARAVTVGMSLGALWNIAKIGEIIGGSPRAGCWCAATCGANAVFTYYSQTTNLDVPYIFWGILSLRWLVQTIAQREPRWLRRVAILAACAIATKDQAYALFLVGLPASLLAWLVTDRSARRLAGEVAKELAVGTATAAILLLLIDGALVNPIGFRDRMRTLVGSASQDHAYYAQNWAGRLSVLRDSVLAFPRYYPWMFAPVALFGMAVTFRASDRARRAAGLAPLAFALSFTIAFNLTARRTEHRFLLPQAILLGIYAGLAFDWLERRTTLRFRCLSLGGTIACFSAALFGCAAVDMAMVFDPRYEAEAWMRAHVRAGDRVEVYGNNVYLPRLPAYAVLTRVDPSALGRRNPLVGVTEVSDRFSNVEAREPRFIVMSEFWANKYLVRPEELSARGHVPSPEQVRRSRDLDARDYFRELHDGQLNYRWAHVSTWRSRLWPRVDIHASLTRDVWIFERTPALSPE